jgi:hypothetical protein
MGTVWVVLAIALMLTVVEWAGWWLMSTVLGRRRKARFAAEMAAYCRKVRPALPGREPEPEPEDNPPNQQNKQITVAELVARIEGEGLPTRLRW